MNKNYYRMKIMMINLKILDTINNFQMAILNLIKGN